MVDRALSRVAKKWRNRFQQLAGLHDGPEKRDQADLSFLRFWSLELLFESRCFFRPHSCLSVWRSVLSEQTDLTDLVDWEWLSNVSERLSLT